ncbi:MAG: ATP-binding cassette domain-containing protein [Bacteroidetes bacterium]|jgi:ABC-2 type transport system ATP-binding protein|nr:ATP-binding cassette domain-containing protein [Bacteroidota bacterium]
MALIVDTLRKTYGSQQALDGVSFRMEKGEIVGFLGPNGAGKSTTMKIITGFIQPTAGTAQLDGLEAGSLEMRRRIGYLPEHNPLYLDMYVHEFLRFTGRLYGLRGAQLGQRIAELIAQTGLQHEQHKKIGALSRGYRQRVGIAQALIHDPELLILDEPTSGLDPNQVIEIRNLIKEVGRTKTVLFSSHILPEVEAVAQRVILIHKGQIKADDSLAALTRNRSLEQMFQSLTQ